MLTERDEWEFWSEADDFVCALGRAYGARFSTKRGMVRRDDWIWIVMRPNARAVQLRGQLPVAKAKRAALELCASGQP